MKSDDIKVDKRNLNGGYRLRANASYAFAMKSLKSFKNALCWQETCPERKHHSSGTTELGR